MTEGAVSPQPGSPAGHAFISYVHEDARRVSRLRRKLEAAGVRVWLDTADLRPGEDWSAAIRRAITDDAFVFIACFSQVAVSRSTSYQNEELTEAIGQMRRRRPGERWLIPVRLDDCQIPDFDIGPGKTLRSLQHVDLFGRRQGTAQLVADVQQLLRQQAAQHTTHPPGDHRASKRGPGKPRATRALIASAVLVAVAAVLIPVLITLDSTPRTPSAGPAVSPSSAMASTAQAVPPSPAPVLTTSGTLSNLYGVAAISARSAWAVGSIDGVGKTVIEQWNGTTWKLVPSPPEDIGFRSVAAVSADSAWAVSGYANGESGNSTLIVHWDGKAWNRVPSPDGDLYGVAATAADNAWAVGVDSSHAAPDGEALILHWNGAAWNPVPTPSPGPGGSQLYGVAATAAGSAWAVGCTDCLSGPNGAALIMHWNGTAWTSVPSPSPSHSILYSVAAISADSAWAVGYTNTSRGSVALILRWNGEAWTPVPCPGSVLSSVTATSAQDAWAVGGLGILHWNGTVWTHVPSPAGALSGVTATSVQDAWAVGIAGGGQALILRWNGQSWTQVPSPAA